MDENAREDTRRMRERGRTMPHANTAMESWRLKAGMPVKAHMAPTKSLPGGNENHSILWHHNQIMVWHAEMQWDAEGSAYPIRIMAELSEPRVEKISRPWYTRKKRGGSTVRIVASYVCTPSAMPTLTIMQQVMTLKQMMTKSKFTPTAQPLRCTEHEVSNATALCRIKRMANAHVLK
ncbi:MAG: hypothetical protein P4L87_22700, partial [Formivibrio sp.]|nr:hypothetical protein [Formivibrio sp.]